MTPPVRPEPTILSPEEFRKKYGTKPMAQRVYEDGATVTVGAPIPMGVPVSEINEMANEGSLTERIAARLALLKSPEGFRTEPRKVGLAETVANVATGNLIAPFSEQAASSATDKAIAEFAQSGGDPAKHANLLGIAAAGGAVTGNAGLARATPLTHLAPGTRPAAIVGTRAVEGAAANAGASLAGSVVDGDDLGTAAKKAALNAATGAALGAAFSTPQARAVAREQVTTPDAPKPTEAEQVRAEILSTLDPRDRAYAMNDPHFSRAFNPSGKPIILSPQEFRAAKAKDNTVPFPAPKPDIAPRAPLKRAGATDPEVMADVAATGIGAAAGAASDDENRARGAMAGGAAGLALATGASRMIQGAGSGPGLKARPGFADFRFNRQEPTGTPYKAPVDDGADPRQMNLAKIELSPEAEAVLRKTVEDLGLSKKRVSHAEMIEEANRRSTDPDALIRLKGNWDGIDALSARQITGVLSHRIAQLSNDLGKALPEQQATMRAEISRLTDDLGLIAGRGIKERSAAGRNLNAYKIVARSTMDVTTWTTLAQRAKGGDIPLSTDEILKVRQLATAHDREGLIKYVSSLHESTPWEKALTLWKAGLLTSPVTHVVNNASNATMAAMETAKEPIALMADRIISLVRGDAHRRTKAGSFTGLIKDPILAIGPGVRAAAQVLRTGMTPADLAKWDHRQTNYDSPIVQAYTDVVFNSLSAEDQLWRKIAMARTMDEHVRLAAPGYAKTHNITVKAAIQQLKQNPPDDLALKAVADAEIAVFQNPNALAEGISSFKRTLREKGGARAQAAAEFVMPFVRTPTNVAARLVEYSPIGYMRLYKVLAKELPDAQQKALAETIGRATLGTGFVWLGYTLAAQGKATGAAPRDQTARSQFEIEGKQANSVRMGDQWVNVSRLSPAGMLVALGAQMHDIAGKADSKVGAVGASLYAPARVALDQSFLKGVSGALDAANDPSRYGERFMENTAGSIVPAGVAAVARGVDPVVRRPEGIMQTVASRIPGASKTVPARRTAFGDVVQREEGIVGSLISPMRRTQDKTSDVVVRELARLGVSVGMPSRTFKVGKGRNAVSEKLTQDEYGQLVQEMGPAVRSALMAMFADPGYQQLGDDDKANTVDRLLSRTRRQVYALQRARRNGRAVAGEESEP